MSFVVLFSVDIHVTLKLWIKFSVFQHLYTAFTVHILHRQNNGCTHYWKVHVPTSSMNLNSIKTVLIGRKRFWKGQIFSMKQTYQRTVCARVTVDWRLSRVDTRPTSWTWLTWIITSKGICTKWADLWTLWWIWAVVACWTHFTARALKQNMTHLYYLLIISCSVVIFKKQAMTVLLMWELRLQNSIIK